MQWQGEIKPARRLAELGLCLAAATVLGYVEAVLPINIGLPGMKLGLANCAIVFVLYAYGIGSAVLISILRTLLIALLFTNLPMLLYSLTGALFSLFVMGALKRGSFSVYGISAAGGVAHNAAQLALACAFAGLSASGAGFILRYLALLILCGAAAGLFNGFFAGALLRRICAVLLRAAPLDCAEKKE